MSGIGGHGGTVDFNTYLVGSGTGHGLVSGHTAGSLDNAALFMLSGPVTWSTLGTDFGQPHDGAHFWHIGHCCAGAHPDGFATSHLQFVFVCPQTLHCPPIAKPSTLLVLRPRR